ncbi:serine/threonine-protein kinase [Tumidithrix elongata RA019]|uniref:non-specific serine/threonine protein kinase n=1 Tax=Tumidithrix elongata BACA0141 TaxID=2716417 RepID=A0AAW9Q6P7_9CYAN|nr:serine/threonine-protein kinase [Tumidithrix elongata RA019]
MQPDSAQGIRSSRQSAMQSPIPQGSVLRDRYVVKSVIGQGGMGRTYIAQDLERFNEACVLKEFIPPSQSPDVAAKAKELFQREASILYQIRHPQVPQFRATFEVAGRLLLVQDYVDGDTFRALLSQRIKQGHTFSEIEIITLLRQVLPILSYLHGHGIIHRDISPENLMLRSQDQLPVLIDFGVVQAATNQLNSQIGLPASTVAGKLGYAPPEQMQSGNAYASSDLYALAVTAVVLLTGKEPADIFDGDSLTWQWQRYASLSPAFAQVLNRMLSYKPANRYRSADEVLQALQMAQASLSQVRTYAVARNPQEMAGTGLRNPSQNISQNTVYAGDLGGANTRPSKGKGGGLNLVWGFLIVVFAGLGSWAITSIYFERGRNATISPTPTVSTLDTIKPTTSATATPTPTVANVNKNLEFTQGVLEGSSRAAVSDKITAGQTVTFRFNGERNQNLVASLGGLGLQMTIKNSDLKPLDSKATNNETGYWQGKLPYSGVYFITIRTVAGVSDSNYSLDLQLEGLRPTPKPTPTNSLSPSPTPTATPTEQPTASPTTEPPKGGANDGSRKVISKRIDLPPGSFGTAVDDQVASDEVIRYSVGVLDRQTLTVVVDGGVRVEIFAPNGGLVWNSSSGNVQEIPNTTAGNYKIVVTTERKNPASFRLNVSAK